MNTMLFAAAQTTGDSFGIDWSVLGIVLAGVTVLMFAIRVVGLASSKSHDTPGTTTMAPKKVSPAKVVTDALSPELVAVLTAAATVALGQKIRLLSAQEVRFGNEKEQRAWAQEGRREIYLSHRIR